MKKGLFWVGGILVLVLSMSLNVFISTKNGDGILPSVNLSKISVEAQVYGCCRPEVGSYCCYQGFCMVNYYYFSSGCGGDDVEIAY